MRLHPDDQSLIFGIAEIDLAEIGLPGRGWCEGEVRRPGATGNEIGETLLRREKGSRRRRAVGGAEGGADGTRAGAGFEDDQGFGQPEDEVGKVERVLGRV